MSKYKILENRRALTKEQIEAGMDFKKIGNKASALKKSLSRWLIYSIVATIITVAAFLLVYRDGYDRPSNHEKQKSYSDTVKTLIKTNTDEHRVKNNYNFDSVPIKIIPKKIVQSPANSEKKLEEHLDSNASVLKKKESDTLSDIKIMDSTIVNANKKETVSNIGIKAFSDYSCKIVKRESICSKCDSLNLPYNVSCQNCDFSFSTCKEMISRANLTAIILSKKVNKKARFILKSHFENIALIKSKEGKEVHPLAMAGLEREYKKGKTRFLKSDFKARKVVAYFHNNMELLMLFEDAKAGDKIIIDNAIEVEIEN